MDADWINRAGILAEAVSFFLIAPEILGVERLQRAEDVLEEWFSNESLRKRVADHITWLLYLGALIVILLGLFVFDPPLPKAALLVCAVPVGIGLVGLGLMKYSARLDEKAEKDEDEMGGHLYLICGWLLFLPALPVVVVFYQAIAGALIVPMRLSRMLLTGEGRLRALVFGTGVLLLLGGMAAQFVATF
jgi:nitrogen fixation protein